MPLHTKRKLLELLVDCPLCGRTGFTVVGLRHHYCAVAGDKLRKKALTAAQWQATVAEAQCRLAMGMAGAR